MDVVVDPRGGFDIVDTGFNRVRHVGPPPVNQAPVANAGPDQEVPSAGGGSEIVHLDGRASSDADGDALTYEWTEGSTALGSGAEIDVVLAPGPHTLTLTVTDTAGNTSSDTVSVTVVVDSNEADISVSVSTPSTIVPGPNDLTLTVTLLEHGAVERVPRAHQRHARGRPAVRQRRRGRRLRVAGWCLRLRRPGRRRQPYRAHRRPADGPRDVHRDLRGLRSHQRSGAGEQHRQRDHHGRPAGVRGDSRDRHRDRADRGAPAADRRDHSGHRHAHPAGGSDGPCPRTIRVADTPARSRGSRSSRSATRCIGRPARTARIGPSMPRSRKVLQAGYLLAGSPEHPAAAAGTEFIGAVLDTDDDGDLQRAGDGVMDRDLRRRSARALRERRLDRHHHGHRDHGDAPLRRGCVPLSVRSGPRRQPAARG